MIVIPRKLRSTMAAWLAVIFAFSSLSAGVSAEPSNSGNIATEEVSTVQNSVYEPETVSHSVYGKLAVTESVYEASDLKYFQYTGIYGYDSDGYYTAIKIKITGYDGPGGEVTVPTTLQDLPVTELEEVFKNNLEVNHVVIPTGVEVIGPSTFEGALHLESVQLSDGLLSIEQYAFKNSGLSSIDIPNSVTNIGKYAFMQTAKLMRVRLPDHLVIIQTGTFMDSGITEIDIPESVRTIKSTAFEGSIHLSQISLPPTSQLETIGSSFIAYTAITEFLIPPGVITLDPIGAIDVEFESQAAKNDGMVINGIGPFSSTSLKMITIPETVTSLGAGVFLSSLNLEKIIIENPSVEISPVLGSLPQQATIVSALHSTAHDYAVANNMRFKDISEGTDVPALDHGGQDIYSRYQRGESVVIKDLFESTGLANTFVRWLMHIDHLFTGQLWSGTVDDTINKRVVEGIIRVGTMHSDDGRVSFFLNNVGILNEQATSLKGLEIFDQGLLINPRVAKMISLEGSFENTDSLRFLEDAELLSLVSPQLTDITGLQNLKKVQDLTIQGQITDVDALANLQEARNLNLFGNRLYDLEGLSQIQTLTGNFSVRANELTNRNIPALAAIIARTNPFSVDLLHNYFSLEPGINSAFFEGLQQNSRNLYNDQFQFGFTQSIPVKVEYRVKNTNALLGSETKSYALGATPTFQAKSFSGYTLSGESEKTVMLSGYVKDAPLQPTIGLKGIYLPDPVNKLLPKHFDWGHVTFQSAEQDLPFDPSEGLLSINGMNRDHPAITVSENGVYHGTYNLGLYSEDTATVVFYYVDKSTQQPKLTIEVRGQGTTYPSAGIHAYTNNQWISLSTVENVPGYTFEKWVINGKDVIPPPFSSYISLQMNEDKTAIAYFRASTQEYQLKITQEGNGEIAPYPAGTIESFSELKTFTLIASPSEGSTFEKWVVNGKEIVNPELIFSLTGDTEVTAHFIVDETLPSPSAAPTPVPSVQPSPVPTVSPQPTPMPTATAVPTPTAEPKGGITVEFRDRDTLEEIKEKVVLSDLSLGEYFYIAEGVEGLFRLIGEAVRTVVLSIGEAFKSLTFFYEKVEPQPTPTPTAVPTATATASTPTPTPSVSPSTAPTAEPTSAPTITPTTGPTVTPTAEPTSAVIPTSTPTNVPVTPTATPSVVPTATIAPSIVIPTADTTPEPTMTPTVMAPTVRPTSSTKPMGTPVPLQTMVPTAAPSVAPTQSPDSGHTHEPIPAKSAIPTVSGVETAVPSATTLPSPTSTVLSTAGISADESLLSKAPASSNVATSQGVITRPAPDETASSVDTTVIPAHSLGTVYGIVRDKEGNPVSGVHVELHSNPRFTITNDKGEYRFDHTELGEHSVILINPYTLKEVSRIEVIVYKDHQDTGSGITESVQSAKEITASLRLSEASNEQRIDFVMEAILSPADKDKSTKLDRLPFTAVALPVIGIPLILMAIFFRRKNIIIKDENGLQIAKLRVKAREGQIIDLSDYSGDSFNIAFKNPQAFRGITLIIQYNDVQYRDVLEEGIRSITVSVTD